MMNDIGIDKKQQRYIIKKMINIAIRATYFCFVLFLFLFFFLIIQFQAAFLNYLYIARFTIVHSKTQIKFPLLFIIIIIIIIIIITRTKGYGKVYGKVFIRMTRDKLFHTGNSHTGFFQKVSVNATTITSFI